MNALNARDTRAADRMIAPRLRHRRGTIMVFVLGVLTLLALIGLILIARTHGEAKRLSYESTAVSTKGVTDSVIHTVRELLRKDIWGSEPSATATSIEMPLSNDPVGLNNLFETNEPYDAPGPDDRWLASTTPYRIGDLTVNDPIDPEIEDDVLAWHRVSYIGSDITRVSTQRPFLWRVNSRTGSGFGTQDLYDDESLQDVAIKQTPPQGFDNSLIPGSTTNVSIAVARRLWEADPPITGTGVTPQFPYFDTNADGEVDLYDADGDGVPDSPLSLAIPLATPDANTNRQLYAAVRIVDHSSMLNVNVASSMLRPGAASDELTFDDTFPDYQRRGRRVCELMLDDVLNSTDAFVHARDMVDHRSGTDPVVYDNDIVKTWLAGTPVLTPGHAPFGLTEEASLRHRGILVPFARKNLRTPSPGQESLLDALLPGTLLWSPALAPTELGYDQTVAPRWARFNSDYTDSPVYEGSDINVNLRGWRSLLCEDEAFSIRRHMLTTVSHAVEPPPQGLTLDKTLEDSVTDFDGTNVVKVLPDGPEMQMSWPVLGKTSFPEVPSWARVRRVDLNMGNPQANTPGLLADTKQTFMEYAAAAMYEALSGADAYQSFPLKRNSQITTEQARRNREYLAWQFAANLTDYRDSDSEPTAIEWFYDGVNSEYIYGVEKQPFFTEAYAAIVAGDAEDDGSLEPQDLPETVDRWFHAIELYVPPGWKIPTANLYLNSVGAKFRNLSGQFVDVGPIALSRFRNGSSPPPTYLDGGDVSGTGRYYVFCGPVTVASQFNLAVDTFYTNANFKMSTEGNATVQLVWAPDGATTPIWSNMRTHVIDSIGAKSSRGPLNGNSSCGSSFGKRNEIWTSGVTYQFSLLRSTKGWRFTTGWQQFGEGGLLGQNLPGLRPVYRSLGRANTTTAGTSHTGYPYGELDRKIPESVWPAMFSPDRDDSEPLFPEPGFVSGQPFEAFDSVAQLGRMFMVGPMRRVSTTEPLAVHCSATSECASGSSFEKDTHVPTTLRLARLLLTQGRGDLSLSEPESTPFAGRVDFFNALKGTDGKPWSWRLFDLFTVDSPEYDGVDNDMDGSTDLEDPTEGVSQLCRKVGRININTAPATVMRCIPYMSMLPTSPKYAYYANSNAMPADPALEFTTAVSSGIPLFWDLPSAIVALREARAVDLRLPSDPAADMRDAVSVARAEPKTSGGLSGGSGGTTTQVEPTAFSSIGELTQLDTKIVADSSFGDTADVFETGRFWDLRQRYYMASHAADAYSPDYRYRADVDVYDYIPLQPADSTNQNGGIRGRDVLLERIANMITTRSDVFTAYIAVIDENGNYVWRSQVTLDRSVCFRENRDPTDPNRRPVLPDILLRTDGSYSDDTK